MLAESGYGLGLVAGLDHVMALRLKRQLEHGAQGIFVLNEEDRRRAHAPGRSQPGGTPARRASSSRAVIALVCSSISFLTRSSSASAALRSVSSLAFCAGSSRFTKSVQRELMRVCKESAKSCERSNCSRAVFIRPAQ